MSWALSRPAMSPKGLYFEIAASPRGDLLIWSSETGPSTWLSTNEGSLGILSFFINKIVYKGRWQVVIRQASESRRSNPTRGVVWRRDGVRKRDVDALMDDLAAKIEDGRLDPDSAVLSG